MPATLSPECDSRAWLVADLLAAWVLLLAGLSVPAADTPAAVTFERDVLPIFQARCLRCHGADKQKADLDLRTKAGLLKGGETGPAMTPGDARGSMLWEKITADKMPPGKEKLTAAQKAIIRAWIDGGAKDGGTTIAAKPGETPDRQVTDADRQFWAFRRPVRPAIPTVRQQDRVRNPIDAFILAGLEKSGLTLSPEADRATLLRRVTYDLTGLPPSPPEVDAFLADPAPDAYERLIDRLLASEHYGERWGRHWLDLAGYADSEGILDADYVRTAAWRYRDYVIRAFNNDKPYNRFLQEQLAGDELVDYGAAYRTQKELAPEVAEALIATGYLRCASDTSRPDFVSIKNAPGYYYQTLEDTVKIVASSTLGLTLECAKCHSHKYDPIPQTEYYRVQAIFMGAYRPYQWVPQVERHLFEATEVQQQEATQHNAKIQAAVAQLNKQRNELQRHFGERLFAERLAKLPEAIREDVRMALTTEPAKRTEVQKYLAGKFQTVLRPDPATLTRVLPEVYPEYRSQAQTLAAAVQAEQSKLRSFPEIRALYDLPGEAKTHLLRRGDYLNPGPEVKPGTLSVLATAKPFTWSPPDKNAKTSGRRRAFAEWLTQPEHPLTARVLVNRLWLHHFGEGIVATPDNFGHMGKPPTHPKLLDWLAIEFVAPSPQPLSPKGRGEEYEPLSPWGRGVGVRGWSIKAMHRLILTSSTYRQVSALNATGRRLDPDNRLLWRQRMRRLEAEPLRDGMLAVTGTLNLQMFGPPVAIQRQGDGEVTTGADPAGRRRSVYLQVRRSQPVTLLQVFDQPVMQTNCTRRATSTVSSQALTLLNSDFMVRQAEAFADRVLRESPADAAVYAIKLALARPATQKERASLTAFLDTQATRYPPLEARRLALADLCQMLLSANEFAYVD
jgi:hypothetical protein